MRVGAQNVHYLAHAGSRLRLAACLTALLGMAAWFGLISTPSANAERRCSGTVRAYPSGPNIIASNIRVTRVGCRPARRLLKTYFREVLRTAQVAGGCAHQRQNVGCRVKGWRCTVKSEPPEYDLLGRCARRGSNGKRVIRFDERDVGPG